MAFVVRAYPLIRPDADLQKFISALAGDNRASTDLFYKTYAVAHESAYIQETPHGRLLIVVTILKDDLEAAPRYQAADQKFHAWFKEQVFFLTGVDPNVTPLGPPTTQVFSWSDPAAPEVMALR
jgi:hypothetical protein